MEEEKTWITWENVSLRTWDEKPVFTDTNWVWKRGERWGILGGTDSGKGIFAEALRRNIPISKGKIRLNLPETPECLKITKLLNRQSVTLVGNDLFQRVYTSETGFYQGRWYTQESDEWKTARDFISRRNVQNINPFAVGEEGAAEEDFQRVRQEILNWFHFDSNLLDRRLIQLSNGEQKKLLLIFALLHSPKLLVLDEPFGGLDEDSRLILKNVLNFLESKELPILTLSNRLEDLPENTTHLLLIKDHKVVCSGRREEVLRHPLAQSLAQSFVAIRKQEAVLTEKVIESEEILSIQHLDFEIDNKIILTDISWQIHRGENWLLLGPNGSGKTTLLSLIQGDNPIVYSLNMKVLGSFYSDKNGYRKITSQLGWVSTGLHINYPGKWSCKEVVCSGFYHSMGLYMTPTGEQLKKTEAILKRFGLEHLSGVTFGNTGLGNQRLLLLLRAMVRRPKLLLLDEICQDLDADSRRKILDAVDLFCKEDAVNIIFVTHYEREVPECINHVLKLRNGKILAEK